MVDLPVIPALRSLKPEDSKLHSKNDFQERKKRSSETGCLRVRSGSVAEQLPGTGEAKGIQQQTNPLELTVMISQNLLLCVCNGKVLHKSSDSGRSAVCTALCLKA